MTIAAKTEGWDFKNTTHIPSEGALKVKCFPREKKKHSFNFMSTKVFPPHAILVSS